MGGKRILTGSNQVRRASSRRATEGSRSSQRQFTNGRRNRGSISIEPAENYLPNRSAKDFNDLRHMFEDIFQFVLETELTEHSSCSLQSIERMRFSEPPKRKGQVRNSKILPQRNQAQRNQAQIDGTRCPRTTEPRGVLPWVTCRIERAKA